MCVHKLYISTIVPIYFVYIHSYITVHCKQKTHGLRIFIYLMPLFVNTLACISLFCTDTILVVIFSWFNCSGYFDYYFQCTFNLHLLPLSVFIHWLFLSQNVFIPPNDESTNHGIGKTNKFMISRSFCCCCCYFFIECSVIRF